MNDEHAFAQAMQENPADVQLRLVFADWLEEQADPRAELLRLTHTLTQSVDIPGRPGMETRLRSLLNAGVQPTGPFWTNPLGMKFAWVPAGTFLMGSPPNEEGRRDDEILHKITLTKGFWMGVYPVTEEQWRAVMGDDPSLDALEGVLPIEQVSWDDCQEFIRKWRERDAKPYRLPTEAEWEYACRAGTTTAFSFGDTISTDQANTNSRPRDSSAYSYAMPVGSFPPNAFGLYDMHGSVWEWCQDYYGEYPREDVVDPKGPESGWRVVHRGGSWIDPPQLCRSATRLDGGTTDANDIWGFRLCFS